MHTDDDGKDGILKKIHASLYPSAVKNTRYKRASELNYNGCSACLQETETVYYEKQLPPIRCSPTRFSRTGKTADPACPPSARRICQPSRHGDHMGFYQFGRTLAEASIHSVKEVNRCPTQSKEFHTKALGTGFQTAGNPVPNAWDLLSRPVGNRLHMVLADISKQNAFPILI